MISWFGLALFLCLAVVGLRLIAFEFSTETEGVLTPLELPILEFTLGYLFAGLICFLVLPFLIRASTDLNHNGLLFFILLIALLARLSLLGTPSVLEDDYHRYLWDGAVTFSGFNPYAYSPEQILELREEGGVYDRLIKQSNGHFGQINHPEFSTVYPPAAQAIFAFTHWLSPFNPDGLRLVLLILEGGCIAFILAILHSLGRSKLWVALYAWNPLVLKEITNSMHMEPILMLPVLAAIWFVLKKQFTFSTIALGIAAGVKIWPALLVIVIWRQLLSMPRMLILNASVFFIILLLMLAPILIAGLGETSGFVAFGGQWQASSAVYLVSEAFSYWATPYWVEDYLEIPIVARLVLAFLLLAVIGLLCLKRAHDEIHMLWRMFIIVAAIYILSPSNTPWYFVWIVPFLCIYPSRGLLLAGTLISLHYAFFHFAVRGQPEVYDQGVVWLIWIPVWALLLFDFTKMRLRASQSVATS